MPYCHCFLWGCPPCIYHMMRWLSSALWTVVPVLLMPRRPYRRCLRSRNQACRLSRRQWLLNGWWVGNKFRRPLPTQAGHSSAKGLLTRRETSMNLEDIRGGKLHDRCPIRFDRHGRRRFRACGRGRIQGSGNTGLVGGEVSIRLIAAECAASMAGSIHPSSDGMICSGFRARAAAGVIS